jgi:hypothetical protein
MLQAKIDDVLLDDITVSMSALIISHLTQCANLLAVGCTIRIKSSDTELSFMFRCTSTRAPQRSLQLFRSRLFS